MARRMERDEEQRAYAAYFRFAKGHPVDQLTAALSGMAKYKGLEYVVLRDGSRTLAVYRIKNDGHLHRLKRWPGCSATVNGSARCAGPGLDQLVRVARRGSHCSAPKGVS